MLCLVPMQGASENLVKVTPDFSTCFICCVFSYNFSVFFLIQRLSVDSGKEEAAIKGNHESNDENEEKRLISVEAFTSA